MTSLLMRASYQQLMCQNIYLVFVVMQILLLLAADIIVTASIVYSQQTPTLDEANWWWCVYKSVTFIGFMRWRGIES